MLKLVRQGMIPKGVNKGLKFFEYGFSESDHEKIQQKYDQSVFAWKQKVMANPVIAATTPYPRILIPRVSYVDQIDCETAHANCVKVIKKHNGNIQVIVDQKVTVIPKEDTATGQEIFVCPQCARQFDKRGPYTMHVKYCKRKEEQPKSEDPEYKTEVSIDKFEDIVEEKPKVKTQAEIKKELTSKPDDQVQAND